MNRKLKIPCLLAVTALIAVLAPSAATAANFHSENAETVLKGSQVGTDVLTFDAGTVSCTEVTYAGVQSSATVEEIDLSPKHSGCTAFGFVNATVHLEGGCHTSFNIIRTHKIKATDNCKQTVTAFNCWITILPQTTGGTVTYTNTGAGSSRDLDVSLSLTGLHYIQHSKSFPGCSSGTKTNGKVTSSLTLQGFTTGGTQVGIWST